MDNYIKTIINGLKAWVWNLVGPLEESLAKLKTTANNARDAANAAKSAVNAAKSAANAAKSAADNAQTTADNAQATASNAIVVANNATNKATSAQNDANSATSAANTAHSMATAANDNANVKWDNGMLGCCCNVGANGATMITNVTLTAPVKGSIDIYLLIASFAGTATSLNGIASASINGMNADFGKSVTINQFDLIKVTMAADATTWKAEKTGINLGAATLDAAYTEGVNSL